MNQPNTNAPNAKPATSPLPEHKVEVPGNKPAEVKPAETTPAPKPAEADAKLHADKPATPGANSNAKS